MAFSDGLDLTKSSLERFIEAANYKHSWFFVDVAERVDTVTGETFKPNATLLSVDPSKGTAYTAKARYRIDRHANNVPYDFDTDPTKRYFHVTVKCKQILAKEIIESFGKNGVLTVLDSKSAKTTKELAGPINEVTGLNILPEDIFDQVIPEGAQCVVVRFNPNSLNFAGNMQVNLGIPG